MSAVSIDTFDTSEVLPGDPAPLRARKLPPRDAPPAPDSQPPDHARVTPPDPLTVLTRAYNEAVVELARTRAERDRLQARLDGLVAVEAAVRSVEGVA